jgi:hypothetical protein
MMISYFSRTRDVRFAGRDLAVVVVAASMR